MVAARPSFNSSRDERFSRLSVERLETRDCPAAITLNAAVVCGSLVELSGQVTDAPSTGVSVHFSGAVYHSTFTQPDGSFSLFADVASLGTVHAVAYDENGIEISSIADAEITSNAPQIVLTSVTNSNGNYWTITGHVTDENPGGLVVRFGGPASGWTTTVKANGAFTVTCYIDENYAYGSLTAMTTDWWGLDSNTAVAAML